MEAYYRKTNHIVDFVDNANIFLNNQIESQLGFGFSKAYGAEFYFSKNVGQLTGWISYTLSRAQNKVATFEDNEYLFYEKRVSCSCVSSTGFIYGM